jgi:hypothetical protein
MPTWFKSCALKVRGLAHVMCQPHDVFLKVISALVKDLQS